MQEMFSRCDKDSIPNKQVEKLPGWVVGQLASHFKKGHLNLHLTSYIQVTFRWTKEFNVTLDESIGKYLYSLGVGSYSKYNTKHRHYKEKD